MAPRCSTTKDANIAAANETQIHTHMCYADFGDILWAIQEMDADVISMEAARSQMELLEAFRTNKYQNDIGPGVYDIHSPRIPSEAEIESLLREILGTLRAEQVWVNPDCGLKTRKWEEVKAALPNMVRAAQKLQAELMAKRSNKLAHRLCKSSESRRFRQSSGSETGSCLDATSTRFAQNG